MDDATVSVQLQQLIWFKSSASNQGGGCVEAARLPDGGMALRDSKDPNSPVLTYTAHEWQCFLAGVADGEFDL